MNVLKSKAIDMAALVNYQDGAVVSKTVIAKKTGTVTVFAFDKGQGLSTHSAPFDALVQILDGEARITIAGKPLKVKDGRDGDHAGKQAARFEGPQAIQDDARHGEILN